MKLSSFLRVPVMAILTVVAGAALTVPAAAQKAPAKPAPKPAAKPAAKPAPAPAAVAVVNGVSITQAQVADRLWREQGLAVADRLVNFEIVRQEAGRRKLTVSDAEIQKWIDDYKSRFMQTPGRQPNDWDDFIKRAGMANLRTDAKIQILLEKIGEQESKKAVLTADEEKTALENLERDSHQIRARHILVGIGSGFNNRTEEEAQKRIKEAQDKIAAGAKFEDVAKEYSDDISNKNNGGDLGFFTRGRMVKPFEDAAFGLQANEITKEPVKTSYGFHLIQMLEQKQEAVTPEQKKNTLDELLKQKQAQAKDPRSWFVPLKESAKVTIKLPYEQ